MNQELALRLIIEAVDNATQDIDNVHAHVAKLKDELLSNEFIRSGEGLDALGPKIEALTTPAASATEKLMAMNAALVAISSLIAGTAYKSSVDYEASLSGLSKVLDGGREAAEKHAFALNELALQYGENGQKLVGSMADFVQAGYSEAEAVKMVEDALRLKIAGDLDAAEASQKLISILQGFQAPAGEAGRAIDILNEVSNKYATDVKQLADGMAELSPIAKQTGFSMEETAGLLTPVIEVFGSGSEAAEALKTTLLRLSDDSKPVTDALGALGVSQRDANGALRSGHDIFMDVAAAMGKLSDSDRTYYTQQLTGIDQAAKATVVFGNMGKVLEVTQTASQAAGSALQEVNTRLETSDVQIKRSEEAFRQFGVTLGTQFKDEVTGVISASGNLAAAMARAFDSGKLEPLIAALRPQIEAIQTLLTAVGNNLNKAFNGVDWMPLVNGLKAVSGELGEAFKLLTSGFDLTTVEGLRNVIQAVVNSLGNFAQMTAGAADGLGPFLTRLNTLFDLVTQSYPDIAKLAGETAGFGAAMNYTLPVIMEMGGAVFGMVGKVVNLAAEVGLLVVALRALNAAGVPIGPMFGLIAEAAGSLAGVFLRLSPTVAGLISAVAGFPGAVLGLVGAAGAAGYAIGELINKGVEWASGGNTIGGIIYDLTHGYDGLGESATKSAAAEEEAAARQARASQQREDQAQRQAQQEAEADAARQKANASLIAEADYLTAINAVVQKVVPNQEALSTAVGKSAQQLAQAVTAAEAQAKASKAYSDQLEAEYGTRQKALQADIDAAKAAGDEVKALQLLGDAKKLEVEKSAALVQAKDAEAAAARAKVKALEEEAAATGGVTEEEKAGIAEAKNLSAATDQAAASAKAHYQALTALPPALGEVKKEHALTADEINKFKTAATDAIAQAHAQEAAYKDGKISAEDLGKAHADAAGKLETYTQAIRAHIDQLKAKGDAVGRESDLSQKRLQIQIDEITGAANVARARGDETTAATLARQAKELEAQQSQISADAKSREATISRDLAKAIEDQAKADGVLTTAEQDAIQAAKDAASAKQLEADAAQQSANAKSQEARTTKQAAQEATQAAQGQADAQQQVNEAMGQGQSIAGGLSQALGALSSGAQQQFDAMMQSAGDAGAYMRALDWGTQTFQGLQANAAKADDLIKRLGSNDLATMRAALFDARDGVGALDGAKLDNLNSAVDSAKAKFQGLSDSATTTLNSILDQLDSLKGKDEDIENRRYEVQKASIEAQLSQAEIAGNSDAAKTLKTALSKADELHRAKLKELKGKAVGGPVKSGEEVVVGEQGEETFIGSDGKPIAIGTTGPGRFTAPSDGVILPHGQQAGQAPGMGTSATRQVETVLHVIPMAGKTYSIETIRESSADMMDFMRTLALHRSASA